jgi:hypothetical protein
MKKTVNLVMQLPKWYGIGIMLIYSILLAEFSSTLIHLMPVDESWNSIFKIFTRINYGITILSGFVVWLITALLFHLTALLFNGHAAFGYIISSEYQTHFNVAERTARYDLTELVEKGLLVKTGDKKSTKYIFAVKLPLKQSDK